MSYCNAVPVVERHVTLPYGCVVTAGVHLDTREILPELSVVYCQDGVITMRISSHPPGDLKQEIELLSKLLPNHHQVYETERSESEARPLNEDVKQQEVPQEKKRFAASAKSIVRLKSLLQKK